MEWVLNVDTDENDIAWGEFMRIRVSVSIDKSLRRYIKIKFNGEDHLLRLKYEMLPNFCYECRRLWNEEKECNFVMEVNQNSLSPPR